MESGKLGGISFIVLLAVLVFSVLLLWQQDSIERRLDGNNNHIETIAKENEGLRRQFESLQLLEKMLGDLKSNMEKNEENAGKIERLTGRLEGLSRQVEALSKTKVIQVPYMPVPGKSAPPAA